MQGVSIKPGQKQIKALILGLCALCIVMVYMPQLGLPLTLALPLLACPLVGRRQEPVVFVAAVVPAVSALMAGYDELYAVSLSLLVVLPLAVTRLMPVKKQAGLEGILWYTGAVTVGLTAVAASAAWAMGGPLWERLPVLLAGAIGSQERAGLILYRFAAAGLIRLPDGYAAADALQQAFEPAFVAEMIKSLTLTLESLLVELIPVLFVQSCLIVGLFTALRVQRMTGMLVILEAHASGERKARVALPPGFRMLSVPPQLRGPLLLTAVLALVLMMIDTPIAQTMGQLYYTLFETTFMMVGAAVLVCVCTAKHPRYKTLFGILAAAIFLLSPFVLFLVGMMDQTFHFRVKRSGRPDET